MNRVAAADRGIAMVFQSYALYPHMTVAENMGFALKMLGTCKAEIDAKVARPPRILQIEELLGRKPQGSCPAASASASRSAAPSCASPTSSCSTSRSPTSMPDLRAQMRVEIARLHDELQTTMIYVTHDQVEAMTLADRIVILNNGRVEQQGSPLELYEKPANRFVAGFLGQPKMNFIPARASCRGPNTTLTIPSSRIALVTLPNRGAIADEATLEVGVRPDAIVLKNTTREGLIPGEIVVVEHLGGSDLLHVRVPGSGCIGCHRAA